MSGKYLCVHCRQEQCGCVNPFADNAVLAAMRDDLAQENSMKSIIGMMRRLTDNILFLGDSIRYSGQIVPGITDWLPGHGRIPSPDMVIANPTHSARLGEYDIPFVVSPHVPEDVMYLVEQPTHWIGSRYSRIKSQDDDAE